MVKPGERSARIRAEVLSGLRLATILVGMGLLGFGAIVLFVRTSLPDELPCTGPYIGCWPGPEFEAQGDRLRVAIDAFHAVHGRYPESLEEAGVAPADMQSEFGEWHLGLYPGGADYLLSLGDYGCNGFLLYWEQSRQAWYTDT